MKKIYYVIAIIAVFAISCSKDGLLNNYQDPEQMNGKGAHIRGKTLIEVYPGDDLAAAFERAKAAGKGVVVKLMPGEFTIGWTEIHEFHGTLTGSGKGVSIITNLPGLDQTVPAGNNKLPALLTFIGGDVTISNLSVVMNEGLSWLGTMEMNMLLFSDYSASFSSAAKRIRVNLNNIEVTGRLNKDVELWPGGPVIDFPYYAFYGVKFAPDLLNIAGSSNILRSSVDAEISNCKFSYFSRGVCFWGCKNGNFDIGTKGGNLFNDNNQGLAVNENIGVNVKIANNEFNIPDFYWNGLDINTGEASFGPLPLEDVSGVLGNYEVKGNLFNIHQSAALGIYDGWRYAHAEDPKWINIKIERNTFNSIIDWAWIGPLFNLKNGLFTKNIIKGDALYGGVFNTGINWIDPADPNYLLSWSEGCAFLNNIVLQKDFVIEMNFDTKNYLIAGDLTNVIIVDNGINNRVVGKSNQGHPGAGIRREMGKRSENSGLRYQELRLR